MYRVEMAFGHTDRTGLPLPADQIARAEALALRAFALQFRGAQLLRYQGAYLNNDSRIIIEPSTAVWAYASDAEPAMAPLSDLADEIGAVLRQESVLLTITEQQGQMYWVHPEPSETPVRNRQPDQALLFAQLPGVQDSDLSPMVSDAR